MNPVGRGSKGATQPQKLPRMRGAIDASRQRWPRASRIALLGLALTPLAVTAAAQDGEGAMPAKDYSATQINASNARSLHPVWTFSTGVLGGHEGQPLVVNNTMYVVTPWPNTVYAFDLTQEGYPLRWKHRPEVSSSAIGMACCDTVNRSAFFADGEILYNLLDGHTVALDAASGRELWKTRVADLGSGETTTMAPPVVKDLVIVGASGGELGIRGWLTALDLKTGRRWTAYNTGPDGDMRVRPGSFRLESFKPQPSATESWVPAREARP